MASPGPGTERLGGGNPFRVYPVATLQSLDDVYSWTVDTPGIDIVRSEIISFKEHFGKRGEKGLPIVPLMLAVRGPPGSGKTHLILFARSMLEREMTLGAALMLRASEAPWDRFYTKDVAADLRELDLWRLFTELLAREAIIVANALPATARLAADLSKQPGRVFEFLRRGELSSTEVEIRYRATIDALCPDGSTDLRAVLGSLHKRELSKCASDWLSGGKVQDADLDRLGAAEQMDVQVDALPALGALAEACRRLDRVFMLCLDELERFTDWHAAGVAGNPEYPDRTNIEWLRKLAEAVARGGSVFIVAGQERAWENQPIDVIDRLTFRNVIELTSWDAGKVRELVRSAGDGWADRWTTGTYDAVAALAGGNIRRIQTVLFDLFVRTADDQERWVTIDDVNKSAQRLRPSNRTPDLLGPIARTAENAGGSVERGASPIDGLVLDLLVRKGTIPHLAARKVTVSDEAELARSAVETWQYLNRLRQEKGYLLHCVLIIQGAGGPQVLAMLDRYTTLTVIDGEVPDAEEKARAATIARMAEPAAIEPRPMPVPPADLSVTAQAIRIAERSEEAKIAQRSHLAETYPELSAQAGAFEVADLDVSSATQSREEVERLRIIQTFAERAEEKPPISRFALNVLTDMEGGFIIAIAALCVLILLIILLKANTYLPFGDWSYLIYLVLITISGGTILFFALVWLKQCFDRRNKVQLAHRMAFNVIHQKSLQGASAFELARVRTQLDLILARDYIDIQEMGFLMRETEEFPGRFRV